MGIIFQYFTVTRTHAVLEKGAISINLMIDMPRVNTLNVFSNNTISKPEFLSTVNSLEVVTKENLTKYTLEIMLI